MITTMPAPGRRSSPDGRSGRACAHGMVPSRRRIFLMAAGTIASIERVGCEARTFCRNAPRPRSWRPTLSALAGAIPFALTPLSEHRHGRIHDPSHVAGDHLASLRRPSRLLPPTVRRLRHRVLRRSARGAVLPIRLPPTCLSPPSSHRPTGMRHERASLELNIHTRFARVRPRWPVWAPG